MAPYLQRNNEGCVQVSAALLDPGRGGRHQDGRLQPLDGVRPQLPALPRQGPGGHHGEHQEGDGLRQDLDPPPRHLRRGRNIIEEALLSAILPAVLSSTSQPEPRPSLLHSIALHFAKQVVEGDLMQSIGRQSYEYSC